MRRLLNVNKVTTIGSHDANALKFFQTFKLARETYPQCGHVETSLVRRSLGFPPTSHTISLRHFSFSANRLANTPAKWGRFNVVAHYIHFCNTWQMTAAIVTSFVLWSLGDVLTQKIESVSSSSLHKHKADGGSTSVDTQRREGSTVPTGYFDFVNRRRLIATAAFGVSIIGIGGFYWYRLLDHVVRVRMGLAPETSGFFKFTAAKLGIEFAVWHPVTLAIFWLMVGTYADGKTVREVGTQLTTELPTALACDISLWLPIDILNFRFTPVHLQVIIVNLGSLFEAILLSYLHSAGSP